jgi:hypothetical protein
MKGLLADVNVQGHLPYLINLLEGLQLWTVLEELELSLVTFPKLGLHRHLDDRSLWEFCQRERWVLFTENRNADDPNSLQATLNDSWQVGNLPVLTLSNKRRFENHRSYADRVAEDIATILFGIVADEEFCDQPRIYVPLRA